MNYNIFRRILTVAVILLMTVSIFLLGSCSKQVRISFETNGGEAIEAQKVQKGTKITLPQLANKTDGGQVYIFDGWSASRDLSGDVLSGEIDAPSKNATFYARWVKGYSVTLDVNGGSLAETVIWLKAGASLSDAVKSMVPTGPNDREFIGWYLDDVLLADGTAMPSENVTLVAQYTEDHVVYFTDAVGGDDRLYRYDGEPDTLYLERQGVERKAGTYNADTGIFTFVDEGTVILSGKINGEYFYYFNKTLMRTYTQRGGQAQLSIGDNYVSQFTDAEGNTEEGEVVFDLEWNNYLFRSEHFSENFVFVTDEDETYFVLQDREEAGIYRPVSGQYPAITLDGLGNFKYDFDPEHPTYYDITGEPVLHAEGTYAINKDGYYECAMYVGAQKLEDFLFRVVDKEHKTFERSDFYGDLDPIDHALILDGFGGGVYIDEDGIEHEGTYSIVRDWWMTEDARSAFRVWLINFDYEGATEDVYFALQQDNSGNTTALFFGKVTKNSVGGLYTFDNALTLGGETYTGAFIMVLLDRYNESMVLVKIDESTLSSGETVNVYAAYFTGTVTAVEGQDNRYHFADVAADAQMDFSLGDGTATYLTASGSGTAELIHISDNIVVDPNSGTATYIDEQGREHNNISYTHSVGEILDFYSFHIDDSLDLYYYREIGEEQFTQALAENILDYDYISRELANAYPARLLLAQGTNKAYIAVPVGIGEPIFVGEGIYAQVAGSEDEYTYHSNFWVDGLIDFFGGEGYEAPRDEFVGYYENFTFRKQQKEGEWKFFERYDDMQFALDNFVCDGYSNNAVYTTPGGTELDGTFYRMEIVVVFTCGEDTYYLKEKDGSMVNVSRDAGLYYRYMPDDVFFATFGPDSSGELYDYIVFDGENRVTVVNYEGGFLANTLQGSMVQTSRWSDELREYTVTEDVTGQVYRILLGSFKTIWDDEYLVYDVYNEAYNGEWNVDETFGILRGDGYRLHSATYDEDGDGIVDYTGTMARATFDKRDIQTHAYTVDENGDTIVFTYNLNDENTASKVFNVMRASSSGMEYLVERKLIFGSFAYWDAGVRPGEYMYLDGNGKAERYDASGRLIGRGSYRIAAEIDDVSYYYKDNNDKNDKSASFYFAIYIEQENTGSTYFEYRRYNGDVNGEYDCDDWSHLSVSCYGEIVYTDPYGVVYEGYYSVSGNTITLITHDESGVRITFFFDRSIGYFVPEKEISI